MSLNAYSAKSSQDDNVPDWSDAKIQTHLNKPYNSTETFAILSTLITIYLT